MKRIKNLIIILLAVVGLSANAQSKVGFVDMNKVFDNFYKTKQAQAKLQDDLAEKRKELKEITDKLEKEQKAYDDFLAKASEQAVSPAEREKNKKSAETKAVEVKNLQAEATQYNNVAKSQLDEAFQRMMSKIVQEIQDKVTELGKKSNYSMIYDASAKGFNQLKIFLYTSGENDLTDSILTDLNKGAPATVAVPPSATDTKK